MRGTTSGAAAALSGVVVVLGMLAAVCIGLGGVVSAATVRREAARTRERTRAAREAFALHADAERLLDELRNHVLATHAARREFPIALPEAPPDDPWGHPVRYERSGPDRAWLTSAGPDGQFGTADDVGGEIVPQ